MANDILVDLGSEWGHIVPLSVLEVISHIEHGTDGHFTVACEIDAEQKQRLFKFRSRAPFSDEQAAIEKRRLLGFTTGLISNEDVKNILASIGEQTGMPFEMILADPVYDISFLRKLWATHMGIPFYRLVLQYNPATDRVEVNEDHNQEFEHLVLPAWTDKDMRKTMNEEDSALLFAYEVIYQMVEPLLPEEGMVAFTDPLEHIPTMSMQGVRQQYDLANIDPSQIIASSQGE